MVCPWNKLEETWTTILSLISSTHYSGDARGSPRIKKIPTHISKAGQGHLDTGSRRSRTSFIGSWIREDGDQNDP